MIIKNGNIVSWANNRWRNVNLATNMPDIESLSYHAEYRAIMSVGIDNCRGATIVIARVTGRGAALSRPCKNCQSLIRRAGIKRVIYTTGV